MLVLLAFGGALTFALIDVLLERPFWWAIPGLRLHGERRARNRSIYPDAKGSAAAR